MIGSECGVYIWGQRWETEMAAKAFRALAQVVKDMYDVLRHE